MDSSFLNNPILAPYKEQLLKTKKPTVEMELSPAENLLLWQSKVGGKPYLPLGKEYPTNGNGEPLVLLVQINFEEMPPMESYPTQGILQFFIDKDDLMGLDLDNPLNQEGFRPVYYAEVTKDNALLQQEFPEIDPEEFYLPFEFGEEYAIEFKKTEQIIGVSDFKFSEVIPDFDEDEDLKEELYDIDELLTGEHRIGGYPFFTQYDPRCYGSIPEDYILLLQLDSDDYLMWGDTGVGNFFIHPEDLKNLDFSKVAYTWDCG